MPDTPDDKMRMRMAARAKLADQPPRFLFNSPWEKDANGKWIEVNDPRIAVCGNQRRDRRPDESPEQFMVRVADEFLPVNAPSWPGVLLFNSEREMFSPGLD